MLNLNLKSSNKGLCQPESRLQSSSVESSPVQSNVVESRTGTASHPVKDCLEIDRPINNKAAKKTVSISKEQDREYTASPAAGAMTNTKMSENGRSKTSGSQSMPARSTMARESDEQLVARVQKGDKRAFDLLVIKYQHKIFAIISRFIRDSSEVNDVAQEAFIKAYRALGNFRGDSAFYTWMYRIAINTAKNYLVAKSRRPPASDIELDDDESYSSSDLLKDQESPENLLFRDELQRVVNQTIEELPEDLRTAVTLREFDGLSYEEIAEVMDCPMGTVRSRIFRAREAIDKQVKALMDGKL